MEMLRRILRRILGLYRRSRLLAFIVPEARWHWRMWVDPQKSWDQHHLKRAVNYESLVEQQFRSCVQAAVVKQIGGESWGDALEIGCAEGVFTAYLAKHCRSVSAYDISTVAQTWAAERCAQYPNVRVGSLDIGRDEIPGQYDLVFVMDVLYYINGRRRMAEVAAKLAKAVRGGGVLVFTECRLPKSFRGRFWRLCLPKGADGWADLLEAIPGLHPIYKEVYPPEGQRIPGYWDKLIVLFKKNLAPKE